MKKFFFFIMFMSFANCFIALGQIGGTKNIPGDYSSLADAISDLNTQGVAAGGVTINLVAGNPQTAPAGGYIIGGAGSLVLTTTGASNQVIIQGNGNTITAPTPQTSGKLNDAIFKLIGADYITITGFTMLENPANTTTTAGSNNMTEWGVALLYVTTTDGAQNNTISNCTIDLDRTYQNTFGIYSNSTHTATAVSTSATATSPAGANSGLIITGNTITDVNVGIVSVGPTGAANHCEGCTIGGSPANANTITNYGTTGTFSSYANVSGTVNGILVRNTKNFIITYNNITSSNGGVTAGTLNGIQIPAFSNTPTGTFINSIEHNQISVRSGNAGGAINGINCPSGSASLTSTININYNDFQNCGHTVSGSGNIYFISNASAHKYQNITYNTLTNVTVNTTGDVRLVSNSNTLPSGGIKNVNNNSIINGFSKTGDGGTVYLIYDSGSDSIGANNNMNNNNFSNITLALGVTMRGIYNYNASPALKTISGNILENWICGTGWTNAIMSDKDNGTTTISLNQIRNISAGDAIEAIYLGSTGPGTTDIIQNEVSGISGPVINYPITGIYVFGGNRNIIRNKIYNLECGVTPGITAGYVYGIWLFGGSSNVINNYIGNLTASSSEAEDAIRGISITSTSANTVQNIIYNTIYLNASSTGNSFGTTGIYHVSNSTSTSSALNMQNNIIVNTSIPGTSGLTLAFRRSSSDMTNYAATSNNNLFYAGTPGTSNLIFYDGTYSSQQLSDFKTLVAPRESASISENPHWLSTTGQDATYLHINAAYATGIESGGISNAYTTDYDGDYRFSNPSYTGTGTAPDIGADEFESTQSYTCNTPNPGNTLATSQVLCMGQSVTLSLQNSTHGTGVLYQWQQSANGTVFTNITDANDSVLTVSPDTSTYYQCIVTCLNGPVSGTSNPVHVMVNLLPTANVTVDNDTVCPRTQIIISIALTGTGPWLLHGLTMSEIGGSTYVLPDTLVNTSPHLIYVDPNLSAYYYIDSFTDNSTGCTSDTANWIKVVVKQGPIVSLGHDTAICANQSILLDAGNAGATYLWTPGGIVTQTMMADSTGHGLGTVQYTVQVTANNCSATDTINVTFNPCPSTGHIISGKTRYAAKANTGNPAPNPPTYNPVIYNIDQVIVILKNYPSGTELARDSSDNLGNYQFTNVTDGNYIISYDKYTVDTMQWGNDITVADLSILKYYIGSDTLLDPSRKFSSKYKKAINVDNNAYINVADVSRVKAKIGSPYTASKNFPKGNWLALDTVVTMAGSDMNIILKTICYGDYNASSTKYRDSITSWNGLKSIPKDFIIGSDETMMISNPAYFEIPLKISTKINDFSALGLELNYQNHDFKLVSAAMPKAANKGQSLKINPTLDEIIADDNDLLVTDENGVIRVVYATTNHFDVASDDQILVLGFRSLNEVKPGALEFNLSGTGTIANKYGEEDDDAYLTMPKIFVQGNEAEAGFDFTGYPNPFNGEASLSYTIPENGTVTLNVYNALGERICEPVNEMQMSGQHTVTFSSKDLPAGMYTFRLEFNGSNESKCFVIKMVH